MSTSRAREWLRSSEPYAFLAGIAVTVCAFSFVHYRAARQAGAEPHATSAIGQLVPAVTLTSASGQRTALRDRLGERPALVFVVTPAVCASCENLPLELRVIHNAMPKLPLLVIGSGADASTFDPYFRGMGVESTALVDSGATLLRALGLSAEILTMVVDSSGRVVFADPRGASEASQYPVGRVLRGLGAVLHAAADTTSAPIGQLGAR